MFKTKLEERFEEDKVALGPQDENLFVPEENKLEAPENRDEQEIFSQNQ